MATPIERQAVQGIQRVQSTGAPRSAGTQELQMAMPQLDPSQQGNFLSDLVEAAQVGMSVGADIMNQAVEDDKVRQMDRALTGLMPSEDATVGGARAHMLVNLQNDVLAQTTQLQQEAKTFQGTDEEWEQHLVNSRNAIQARMWQQYPELQGDKNSMKVLTNAFLEQQPQVFGARQTAKIDQQIQKRSDDMRSRIIYATNGLTGDALNASLQGLQQEAITLGLTKPEYESMVADIAQDRAAVGDGSLIEGTKSLRDGNGVSLYQRNGKLMTAEIQANRAWAAQNQVAVFEKKDAAVQAYENGDLSREQMLQIAQNHNDMTGGTAWSDGELSSLFARVAKASAVKAKTEDLFARGNTGSPLGLQDISKKERDEYAGALTSAYQTLAEKEIAANGLTGEDAERVRGKYEQARYAKLGEQLIEDPNIGQRWNALMQMAPENLKDMKVEPEALQTIMRARDSIPEASRRAVMGDDAYAFVSNYDLAVRQGFNTGQAIDFAQRASRSTNLPAGTIKELTSDVQGVVSDVAGGSWLTRGDNMSDMGKDLMMQDADTIARAMKVAGNNNETIKTHLKSYLQGQYTQLADGFFTQGVLVKGDIRGMADKVGVNANDLPLAMRQYINNHKEQLLDASGGMTEKDLYYDVDMKRGMFTIRAGSGRTPLTPAMPISEINGQELLKQSYETKKKERDESKKVWEDSQNRMGSWGLSPTTVRPYKETTMEGEPTAKAVGKMGIADFLVSPAFASGKDLPANYEFGYKQNNANFVDYVAKTENSINAGLDRSSGTYTPYKDAHGFSVGFGHFLTPEEQKNGYVDIDGIKVPFVQGRSELTPERARKLLEQDLKKNTPSTQGWAVGFDDMHPGQQRALMDYGYNLGKNGINNAPTAKAYFEKGRFTDGFLSMLSTASTEGKRSPALLVRRAEAYNQGQSGGAVPKISEVETREDGSMYVKFAGEMSPAFVSKQNYGKIQDGWYQVYPPQKNSLVPNANIGRIKL